MKRERVCWDHKNVKNIIFHLTETKAFASFCNNFESLPDFLFFPCGLRVSIEKLFVQVSENWKKGHPSRTAPILLFFLSVKEKLNIYLFKWLYLRYLTIQEKI